MEKNLHLNPLLLVTQLDLIDAYIKAGQFAKTVEDHSRRTE